MNTQNRKQVGSSFENFLEEQGIADEVNEAAIKNVLVWQLQALMHDQKITKTEMAKRMNTSRSQMDRLFDADNNGVTLATLKKAAEVVGRKIHIEFA